MNPIGPEHRRQHEDIKAVKARLFNAQPKPMPTYCEAPPILEFVDMQYIQREFLPQQDAHVTEHYSWLRGDGKEHRREVWQIIAEVADKHGVSSQEIRGNARFHTLVHARQEAICKAHIERPDLSLSMLARLFGKRCHTTIYHALVRGGLKQTKSTRRSKYIGTIGTNYAGKPKESTQHGR